MASKQLTKLEINALLTKLTQGWDQEAAATIVQLYDILPTCKSKKGTHYVFEKNDRSITGHTEEIGNVSIGSKRTEHFIEGEKKEEIERVGQFKLWKTESNDKKHSFIEFEHFWGAEASTRADSPPNPQYSIAYKKDPLEPMMLLGIDWIEKKSAYGAAVIFRSWRTLWWYIQDLLRGESHEYEWEYTRWVGVRTVLYPDTAKVTSKSSEKDDYAISYYSIVTLLLLFLYVIGSSLSDSAVLKYGVLSICSVSFILLCWRISSYLYKK